MISARLSIADYFKRKRERKGKRPALFHAIHLIRMRDELHAKLETQER